MRGFVVGLTVCLGLGGCAQTPSSAQPHARVAPLRALATPSQSAPAVLAMLRKAECEAIEAGDSRAAFLTAYSATTARIVDALDTGFFQDDGYVRRAAVVFVELFRRAATARAGDTYRAPHAWRMAFHDAATARKHPYRAMMLGINAHIRDLAYAVDDMERRHPTGNNRHDFFAINACIEAALLDTERRMARRYRIHPALRSGAARFAAIQYIKMRRGRAWQLGRRLASAQGLRARKRIKAEIERDAAAHARLIATLLPKSRRTSRRP